MKTNHIYQGDCLEILKTFPDESIDMCITSPPYWALRDYGVEGQLGLEPTFQEYINRLCDIFDEVKRVLKKEGTCWVNLGDIYGTQSGAMRDGKFGKINTNNQKMIQPAGRHKSLCQIPSRFAIEMTNRGWILRNEIIWHKPSCMPSSAKDRFTVDFEKMFFFVKNKKYYFEQQKEPIAESSMNDKRRGRIESKDAKWNGHQGQTIGKIKSFAYIEEGGRNKRSVWSIPPKPYPGAHFAVYPPGLIETPIKAGCPEKGIVLDIFMGSGTTAEVARNLDRQFIGIELNPEYIKLANDRLKQKKLL